MGRVKEMLDSQSTSCATGFVYCLSNPAMPGLVKIGFTNRTTQIRVQELSYGSRDGSATGVPLPFQIIKDWRVPAEESERIERQLHNHLHSYRVPATKGFKAKEFFYLDPSQAVVEIEQALKNMDWWDVAHATEKNFQKELHERQLRRQMEAKQKEIQANREQEIKSEILAEQNLWRKIEAEKRVGAGKLAGLKWGAIWFFGSALLFGITGAKDAALWICLALGAFAYYLTKDGPAQEYFGSQAARDAISDIERRIRKQENNSIDISCPKCNAALILKGIVEISATKIRCPTCNTVFQR